MKRTTRVWAPLLGTPCARWIARGYWPLYAIVVTIVISWPIGIFQTLVDPGSAHSVLSMANALTFPVLLVEAGMWVAALRKRRTVLAGALSEAGLVVTGRPRIGSPSRFAAWCVAEGLERQSVRAAIGSRFENVA